MQFTLVMPKYQAHESNLQKSYYKTEDNIAIVVHYLPRYFEDRQFYFIKYSLLVPFMASGNFKV